jgi:hypothetical protein
MDAGTYHTQRGLKITAGRFERIRVNGQRRAKNYQRSAILRAPDCLVDG